MGAACLANQNRDIMRRFELSVWGLPNEAKSGLQYCFGPGWATYCLNNLLLVSCFVKRSQVRERKPSLPHQLCKAQQGVAHVEQVARYSCLAKQQNTAVTRHICYLYLEQVNNRWTQDNAAHMPRASTQSTKSGPGLQALLRCRLHAPPRGLHPAPP